MKHGEVNFHLTQVRKKGKKRSPNCDYCNNIKYDARHTFFECSRWANFELQIDTDIGITTTLDNIAELMLHKHETWNLITQYVEEVLRTKKKEDQSRETRSASS